MWLIVECAGSICAFLTYIIVLTVQVGMIRVGIWEGLLQGDPKSFLHLLVFQYHCFMIFWSHFKCMTSEPGVLPKNYDTLSFSKMAPQMVQAILGVKKQVRQLEVQHHASKAEVEAIEQEITAQIKSMTEVNEQTVRESKLQSVQYYLSCPF